MSRKEIWRILDTYKKKNKDFIILLTTHHLEEAETLADNMIVLSHGQIKVQGTIEDIKKSFGFCYVIEVISKVETSSHLFNDLVEKLKEFNSALFDN